MKCASVPTARGEAARACKHFCSSPEGRDGRREVALTDRGFQGEVGDIRGSGRVERPVKLCSTKPCQGGAGRFPPVHIPARGLNRAMFHLAMKANSFQTAYTGAERTTRGLRRTGSEALFMPIHPLFLGTLEEGVGRHRLEWI